VTRFSYMLSAYVAAMAIIIPAFVHPSPRLIWNASASIPTGLYAARPIDGAGLGDLVAAAPPPPLAAFLAARQYLPLGVPLLKPVAAVGAQRICRTGAAISIDGRHVADALSTDRRGRPLPSWRGCRVLGRDQTFLMNATVPDSFDGRYFGPLPRSALQARLQPLWVRDPHVPARLLPGRL